MRGPVEQEAPATTEVPRRGGPTVLRLMLGARLRELRESKGITAEDAGYVIRGSQSKISRLELGRVGVKERDIADLLRLYGVTDETEREALLSLAREANVPGWWERFNEVVPSWRGTYIGLEEAASMIRGYEAHRIPDLLQTEEYARAVATMQLGDTSESDVERRVDFQRRRQRLVTEANHPRLWFVLDEAALRRAPCDALAMRAQLEHLIELTRDTAVSLQILPFHKRYPATNSFTILRFSRRELPDLVYLEQLDSALHLDRPADVELYVGYLNRLVVIAEPVTATEKILQTLIKELSE
ncbi:helix-turn-helix transcriptional regulator [Actinomadura miaoliensis]|uniref:Helix-turn-helix transcriptional regulator n=1 Tax=Actinomadura miaoliensis TaxID=430685 RepID=A0ABP7W622_9ACTN